MVHSEDLTCLSSPERMPKPCEFRTEEQYYCILLQAANPLVRICLFISYVACLGLLKGSVRTTRG